MDFLHVYAQVLAKLGRDSRLGWLLALANVARMLRPGGFLLSNTRVFPAIPLRLLDGYLAVVYRGGEGDRMFWYQRQQ